MVYPGLYPAYQEHGLRFSNLAKEHPAWLYLDIIPLKERGLTTKMYAYW